MKILFFSLLLFLSATAQSQMSSNFYNEKGQFYLDTTLTISKAQNSIWNRAELNLSAIFSDIKFPPICAENAIKSKGILIASFKCDTSDIEDITILRDSSGQPAFALAVQKGLQECGKNIVKCLKLKARNYSPENLFVGRYYIAFDFMLIDFYEQMKSRKAIPIIKGSLPLISRGQY